MTALAKEGPRTLDLQASVACPFSITLPPGVALTGKDKDSCILAFGNGDGIGLTADPHGRVDRQRRGVSKR